MSKNSRKIEMAIYEFLESTKTKMSKLHDIEECHKFLNFFAALKSYNIYELMEHFKMSKKNILKVLNVLLRFALLYNFYSENSFNDIYSRFELSKLGKAYRMKFNI